MIARTRRCYGSSSAGVRRSAHDARTLCRMENADLIVAAGSVMMKKIFSRRSAKRHAAGGQARAGKPHAEQTDISGTSTCVEGVQRGGIL